MNHTSNDDPQQIFLPDDELIIEDDDPNEIHSASNADASDVWEILIVDDEPEVHEVTRLALRQVVYADKPLKLLFAYGTDEAKHLLHSHPDLALILLDVVMEEKDSGLRLIHYIRETLNNRYVGIILRTGQPGEAPEESIILNYAINDYKTKAELSRQKLFTAVISGLRSYDNLTTLEAQRRELEKLSADLKAHSQALQQAKKTAESANQAKSNFLRIINHELRTPLNIMVGTADMLAEEVYGSIDKKQHDALTDIIRSGHHLTSVVNDILDFSDIQAEKLPLSLDAVKVTVVCRESIQLIEPLARQKNIAIFQNLPEENFFLEGDSLRLKQILVNLLDNAIKFTPSGGQVGVQAECDSMRSLAFLTVWDTGIGMDPPQIEELMQPFTQADSSLTRSYGGIGLGLSLVYRLIKMHQGEISIESQLGEGGTRVTCTLPLRLAGAIPPEFGQKPAEG